VCCWVLCRLKPELENIAVTSELLTGGLGHGSLLVRLLLPAQSTQHALHLLPLLFPTRKLNRHPLPANCQCYSVTPHNRQMMVASRLSTTSSTCCSTTGPSQPQAATAAPLSTHAVRADAGGGRVPCLRGTATATLAHCLCSAQLVAGSQDLTCPVHGGQSCARPLTSLPSRPCLLPLPSSLS
jgi:hypothetical protein